MTAMTNKTQPTQFCGYAVDGTAGDSTRAVHRISVLSMSRLGMPCSMLLLTLVANLGIALLLWVVPELRIPLLIAQVLLIAAGITLLRIMLRRISTNVVLPLASLTAWARTMRSGRLSARVEVPKTSGFTELANDINSLGERLEGLTHEMDERVRKQTTRLAHQTRSLAILYEVAASINKYRDLDDLLNHFLHTLRDVTDARAASVRLIGSDDKMRLVASLGLGDEVVRREQVVTDDDACICQTALTKGTIQCNSDAVTCNEILGESMFHGEEKITLLAVPLRHRGRDLGVYTLFLDETGVGISRDFTELLNSIGRHLGMAIEKAYMDTQSQRMTIMQERTMLAHELHDSLAQTLASLRYQIKVHEDTLQKGHVEIACEESTRIRNSLEEAHSELRHLLYHFRAPLGGRGLMPAIEELVKRFRKQSGISIYLQKDCEQPQLSAVMEMQVVRIIQEALTNVRKHAQAHTVRLLVSCNADFEYRVLIEDDGTGLEQQDRPVKAGEHIGMEIMNERARRIGATLRIESEPGEGTHVELTFKRIPSQLEPSSSSFGYGQEEITDARTDH